MLCIHLPNGLAILVLQYSQPLTLLTLIVGGESMVGYVDYVVQSVSVFICKLREGWVEPTHGRHSGICSTLDFRISISGIVVSIAALRAVDPGTIAS